MSNTSAAQWVKFFNTAGIPSPSAATYAHKFVENRIQTDMLMDLNKEYLREMGIDLMGDIIAILRHAKNVSDQTARDRVLNTDVIVPIAAIPANPISTASKSTKIRLKSKETSPNAVLVLPMPKPARRVLPEHEGKYKIKLPTGSTERSKEILAKKAKLYSDRDTSERPEVFKRLSSEAHTVTVGNGAHLEEKNIKIRVTGIGKSPTQVGSIFARLGDKTEEAAIAKQIKPILKNTTKTTHNTGIIKAKTTVAATIVRPQKQKVILVKKVPIKMGDDSDFDEEEIMNDSYGSDDNMSYEPNSSVEKFVKFSSTAEVREIAPEPTYISPTPNRRAGNFKGNVKARLDLTAKLRNTKRSFNLKASPPQVKGRISPVKGKSLRLKSDELILRHELPVRHRLGQNATQLTTSKGSSSSSNAVSALSKRIGSVNITGSTQRRYSLPINGKRRNSNPSTSSVFDRLGFTK